MHAKLTGEFRLTLDSAIAHYKLWCYLIESESWLNPNETFLHFMADLWSQSEFRTQRKSQQKTDPKSEMPRCIGRLHSSQHSAVWQSTDSGTF